VVINEVLPPPMFIPPEIVPQRQPQEKIDTMLDRWNILEEVRDMRAEGPVFTTFTGPEPDIWPLLVDSQSSPILAMTVFVITVIMVVGAFFAATKYRKMD
jgi:hypothetical protein